MAGGLGKNLVARASAFWSKVARSVGWPLGLIGPVKVGSLGGSGGKKLLQRAHLSRFHRSFVSSLASSNVSLQAFIRAWYIVFISVRRLVFRVAFIYWLGASLYRRSALHTSYIASLTLGFY